MIPVCGLLIIRRFPVFLCQRMIVTGQIGHGEFEEIQCVLVFVGGMMDPVLALQVVAVDKGLFGTQDQGRKITLLVCFNNAHLECRCLLMHRVIINKHLKCLCSIIKPFFFKVQQSKTVIDDIFIVTRTLVGKIFSD